MLTVLTAPLTNLAMPVVALRLALPAGPWRPLPALAATAPSIPAPLAFHARLPVHRHCFRLAVAIAPVAAYRVALYCFYCLPLLYASAAACRHQLTVPVPRTRWRAHASPLALAAAALCPRRCCVLLLRR